jgi:hypothetical protein
MPSPRRLLASLALASLALWITTAAASAQSTGLPSAPSTTVSPPKLDHAVQAVKQTAAPVSQTVKQVTSTVSNGVKSVPKALPATPPPPHVALPKPRAPEADVEPLVHETQAAVEQVVEDAIAAVPDLAPVVATVLPDQAAVTRHDVPGDVVEVVVDAPTPSKDVVVFDAPLVTVEVVEQLPASTTPEVSANAPTAIEPTAIEPTADEPTDGVLPIGDAVVAIHDREPIIMLVTAPEPSLGPAVDDWPALIAPSASVRQVAESGPIVAAEIIATPEAESAREASPPTSAPVVPSQPQPAVPTSLGFSSTSTSNSPTDWLTSMAAVSGRDSWTRLFFAGRKLPSVIVLPNLAPPG